MQQVPLFVVGTGRCGSTMLSRMLDLHPALLSLSEFFTALKHQAFSSATLDGPGLWQVLNSPSPVLRTLKKHELWTRPGADAPASGPQPDDQASMLEIWLRVLARQQPDPGAPYRDLERDLASWPSAPARDQYLHLFEWLKTRLGRTVWIERSGGSLNFLPALLDIFPDARFVHLYRDGRDCALSMSKHTSFRLGFLGAALRAKLGHNPYGGLEFLVAAWNEVRESFGSHPYKFSEALRTFQLPANWEDFLPERFNVESFRKLYLPPHLFGAVWSNMIVWGLLHLAKVPPRNVLSVRYEQLLAAPEDELKRLMQFFGPGLAQPEWLAAAADTVERKSAGWLKLPEEEKRLLNEACEPGMRLLRQLGSA